MTTVLIRLNKKGAVLLLITAFMLPMTSLPVNAEIPQAINYQGKVTDAGGDPVVDGTYTMQFRIYDTATGGTELWASGSCLVDVSGGIFAVMLGESPQTPLDLTFDADYWLEVEIAGDVQTPRVPMGSVGYAYMASGVVPGTEVSGSVTSGSWAAIKAINTATTGNTYGLFGENSSTEGSAVYGRSPATSGFTSGVRGYVASSMGKGVYGEATATTGTTYGAYGSSASTSGVGIFGATIATEGTTRGVSGASASTEGTGVYGVVSTSTGTTYGVHGASNSTSGRGVYGEAWAASGSTYGGYFTSNSASGRGVYGEAGAATGFTYGGYFTSLSTAGGIGVRASASATSGYAYGGHFHTASTSGVGVLGYASATSGSTCGVYGISESPDGCGVYGRVTKITGATYGVFGESASTEGRGVLGVATGDTGNGQGVRGESASSTNGVGVYGLGSATYGQNYGVFGRTYSPDGYGVYSAGNFAASGTKSCVVRTSQGPTLMYCQESPENWFEDVGEGRLVNGRCHIELDPLFLETVSIDDQNPMRVFVQLHDEHCEGVAVKKGITGFDVIELRNGHSNGSFDFRVMAKRKGFETKRLDYCKAAEGDSYLYPELRDPELSELEESRAMSREYRIRLPDEDLGKASGSDDTAR